KMEAADNEKPRKEIEKLKARMEKAEKGEAQSLQDKEQISKKLDEPNARAELRKAADNDLITKLNRQVDNLQREKQAAAAETAVKAVDSSATTQANTTTAGPIAPSHSLPPDGAQVLPSQGVPQGMNSSTPLPSRGAMRGARAQNFQGPREYYNQNISSHRSITFQDPLVQQVHTVEGGPGYVDPYYDEPTDFQEVRIGDCNSTAPQFNQSTRGTFHPPQQQHQSQPQFLSSQPPPQQFPPPQQHIPPQQFLPPQPPQQQLPPQQPPLFQPPRQPQAQRAEKRKIPTTLCPRFGERYNNRDFNTFEW
ncbi:MAG: aspartyl-phosphate phosphatase Spo0E family protein, partial [Gammaproteobacteria bacterium]|nr:aspartyl-phosphate phosphatase Spo0E family protein [Gammaproteobacteria bacterium]